VQANILVDAEVNFGDVPVGLLKKRTLEIKNDGNGSITVTAIKRGVGFTGDAYVFGAPTVGPALSSMDTQTIEVTFQPLRADEMVYTTDITLETNATDLDGNAISKKIVLKGRGIRAAVSVDPNPLDFGQVLAGSSRTLSVRVTNLLSDPITLTTELDGMRKAVTRPVTGGGRFIVVAPNTSDGSLLPGADQLAPGAFIDLPVRYETEAIATGRGDEAKWIIQTCPDSLCEVTITLRGQATDSAVSCDPATLDFGAVNPGRTLSRSITCTNVASDTITTAPWKLDPTSDASFGLGTFPAPVTVPQNGTFQVPVDFSPTAAQLTSGMHPTGVAIINANGPAGTPLAAIRVPLNGRAGGPTIEVTPSELHFGPLALGTHRTKSLVVTNTGYEDLIISNIDGDHAMTGAFRASPPSITLAVGTTTVVRVTFEPTVAGPVASTVSIESNDALSPTFLVPVDGAGVDLPPCVYTLAPGSVNYGVVIAGETQLSDVVVTNVGTHACLMNDVNITSAFPRSSHQLVNGPETGIMLAPGDAKHVPLRYTPTRTGTEAAELSFYISDPAAPDVIVPLFGFGQATTEISCPPNQVVQAGARVILTAVGMTVGRNVTGYGWNILSAPPGGATSPGLWDPDPPTDAIETFNPFIVGRYVIEVTVFDSDGGSATCQTTIDAEGSGLRVTMNWDGPGDVDLHLHRPGSAQPWFGGFGGNNDDCYYGNRTPIWDLMSLPSSGPNPELDFDNTSADGPENTTVLVPEIGGDYTIGVHNYSSAAGRTPTIDIYCGTGLLPVASFTKATPLVGNGGGQCTQNDFWKVAVVRFLDPITCAVTPIDTVVTSADACLTL